MKRVLIYTLSVLALMILTACGGKKVDYSKMSNAEKIVGTWTVDNFEMSESGMEMTMSDVVQTFNKDMTYTSSGQTSMAGAGMPGKMVMKVTASGTYSIEGDTITSTVLEADVDMIESPEGMPDMSGMMADQMKAVETKQTIVLLDGTTLTTKDSDMGMEVSLTRK